jgi:hypothetical protein
MFHFNCCFPCIRSTSLTYSDFRAIFEKVTMSYMLGNVVCGFNILFTTTTAFRCVAFKIHAFSFIFLVMHSPAFEEICLLYLLDYHDSDFWLTQFSFIYALSIRTFTSHLNIVIDIFLVTIIIDNDIVL